MLARIALIFTLVLNPCVRWAAASQTSTAATPSPKDEFVGALRQFLEAVAGSYGDEGPRVQAALAAMDRALAGWDAAIKEDEAAAATQDSTAELHGALGLL